MNDSKQKSIFNEAIFNRTFLGNMNRDSQEKSVLRKYLHVNELRFNLCVESICLKGESFHILLIIIISIGHRRCLHLLLPTNCQYSDIHSNKYVIFYIFGFIRTRKGFIKLSTLNRIQTFTRTCHTNVIFLCNLMFGHNLSISFELK